jgi:hypothetical protein
VSPKEEESIDSILTYQCYDCGNVWDNKGIDVYQNKDVTKYICKQCRGRCIPSTEIGKVKGVKSIRQQYKGGGLTVIAIALIIAGGVTYSLYDHEVVKNDYRSYLSETNKLRTSVNSHLLTFLEDSKIIEDAKKNKLNNNEVNQAQVRISTARKYLYSKEAEIDKIKTPETSEVKNLYIVETSFWKDPSYNNFLNYMGMYNKLRHSYSKDFLDVIKEKVKKRTTNKILKKLQHK